MSGISSHDPECEDPVDPLAFHTTRWSVVSAARDHASPDGVEALQKLCQTYWYPLYYHLRRRGLSPDDAQDVTQEFFFRLIEKNHLTSVDRSRGRFRAFLLASINHLLSNEWDKARALKRGGGVCVIPLDAEAAEERFSRETPAAEDPERAFDRRWALTVLDRALARMRDDYAAAGKSAQFEQLKVFLSDVAGDGDYALHAEALGIEPGAVAVAVHRLRARYRGIVRDEIAQTVTSAADLKEEMRYLLECLA